MRANQESVRLAAEALVSDVDFAFLRVPEWLVVKGRIIPSENGSTGARNDLEGKIPLAA